MQLRNGMQLTRIAQLSKMKPGSAMAAVIEEATSTITTEILIAKIVVKPQDRGNFSDIEAFAERLKLVRHVHTAILVRALENDQFELIGGERRVRGGMLNDWKKIPAKVFPASTPDIAIRMYQISENVDRKSLSAKETTLGLANDIDKVWTRRSCAPVDEPEGQAT